MSITSAIKNELIKRAEELSRGFYEATYPPVDVYEEGGYLVIVADMPGFNKENIKARITPQNELVIEAEREISEAGKRYISQRPKKVYKVIRLPITAKKGGEITGKYENGVLTLRLPIEGTVTIKIE
ncbi:MAG: hypothetical protein ASUL_03919 [Candidatus Aramenus sulfurataquae]|uniref:SHSP domain-containing protein n=1 Tax=Candidatus Aramenus sulfurataquae TaxID=1326980 RepID=W7L7J2_9CREN|nr:MAG: hypothetical protein ASUL_03919 [Candidatus Aramenus sulfurataquae]